MTAAPPPLSIGRVAALVGLCVGAGALLLQFVITVNARLANGDDLVGALLYYFTFFTILTNIMLVLIYLSDLTTWRLLDWWRTSATRTMMAALMTLVLVFYHFLLGPIWDPEGLFLICDIALHYFTPILFVLWWLLFRPHGAAAWRDLPMMLVPTLIYFIWAMLRGAVVGEYPYPIINVADLGYGQVAINAVIMVVVVGGLCALAIVLDQALGRRGPARV